MSKSKASKSHLAQLDGDRWRVVYRTSDGKRKYHYLGHNKNEISQRDADGLAQKFLASLEIDPGKRDRGKAPALRAYVTRYLANRKGRIADSTWKTEEATTRYLLAYFESRFGTAVRLDQITPAHASDFESAFRQGKLDKHRTGEHQHQKGEKSAATVCAQVRNAKIIFGAAVKEETLAKSPFKHLSSKAPAPDNDWHFVTREELDTLLAATQSIDKAWGKRRPESGIFWKAAIGLARLAGLRRSEILRVKVGDIDLKGEGEKGLPGILVYNKKTVRKAATRPYRFVPISSQLQQILADAIDALAEGEEFIVSRRYISSPHTLSSGIDAVFERAELNKGQAWPEFFQSCRRSRATELAEGGIPIGSHCEVLGHTPEVAQQFYLKTRSHVLEKIAAI